MGHEFLRMGQFGASRAGKRDLGPARTLGSALGRREGEWCRVSTAKSGRDLVDDQPRNVEGGRHARPQVEPFIVTQAEKTFSHIRERLGLPLN
jgi:hypothetical protein